MMPENTSKFTLSPKALTELKEIFHDEYGYDLPDAEAHETGVRLLELFEVLLESPDGKKPSIQPTAKQSQAMVHIRNSLQEQKQPTVRSIAAALSLKSSRSGLRMLNSLFASRLICRDSTGNIVLTSDI